MTPLNHVVTGKERDFALLLVHPLGSDLTFWDDLVVAIDGRATTIACDLRGAGQSPHPGRPVSLTEHADDLEAVREAVGVGALCVIGCAVGTMSAACYAARYPKRTTSLVLANPTPCSAPEARAMLVSRAEQVRREGIAAVLPGAVDRAFLDRPKDARYKHYMNRFSEQDADAYADALIAAAEADASDALRRLRCAVLLVPGKADMLLPMERTEAVAALVPHAAITVIEDTAHFVPYQQPARFAALILDFIGRQALGAAAAARPCISERSL